MLVILDACLIVSKSLECSIKGLLDFNLYQWLCHVSSTQVLTQLFYILVTNINNSFLFFIPDWTPEQAIEMLNKTLPENLTVMQCQSGWDYDNSTYQSTIVTEVGLYSLNQIFGDYSGTDYRGMPPNCQLLCSP